MKDSEVSHDNPTAIAPRSHASELSCPVCEAVGITITETGRFEVVKASDGPERVRPEEMLTWSCRCGSHGRAYRERNE